MLCHDRLPDGSAGGQSVVDVEKKKGRINYGGMRLGKGGEVIETIALDSLKLKSVSMIKIDVQGAEQLVLYGAQVIVVLAMWQCSNAIDD